MTYLSSYDADILYGSIVRGQIVKERIIHQRNRASAWASNFLFMDPASNYYVIFQLFADPVSNTSGDEMVRLHDSDTSTVCTGTDTMASRLEPYRMKLLPRFRCDYIASNTFLKTNRAMPAPVDGNLSQTNACKATSSCESFQIFADHDQVCAGAPVTFTARKNEGCGAIPSWTIDTVKIQSYKILNDSMLQLTYRDATVTNVWGDVLGTCAGYDDYKTLTVLPGSKPVMLNDDSYLCPDSALVLRPDKGFSSYTWQDGSTADTFLVQTPGKYYVTVTNTCSVPSSDTTVVQQAPFLSFSVGSDLSICLRDPVNLLAPAGYNGYSWKNVGDGTIYNAPNIQLYPGSNTTYAATAQTDLGCFVTDTLTVTVSIPPTIDLGPDASFCLGDSLLLNAGSGFTNYSWSNGTQGASVYVHQAGSYSVKAQTTGGCYSTDTMNVISVYSLPLVNLGNNDFLCEGTVRTLNAGNGFRQYQWADGSHAATLQVSAGGMYWVHVTDNNGCMGGDTTNITQIISSPSGFLETDTLICDGYPSKIHAIGQFNNYSWSDGETGNYMTTRKGGTYSLTVTDSYGCSASANIVVNTKQCLFGVYFPNAFTPNRDGHNDYYKSDVFGNLAHYRLQVFNRWGQPIFETKDFSKGWDGTFHGQEQPVGGYAWVCNYQFEGEEEVQEKGTLMLLR
jgi:gliding motility-associated-like protein